jgi:para-aminobenzoate synthetase component 1
MSQLTVESLPYQHDFITVYEKLCDLPGFVLLESCDKTRGRYDIVSAFPYDFLKLTDHSPGITDAFNVLRENLPSQDSNCDLPFQGGAIGYVSYDLAERLSKIKSMPHPSNAMPLLDLGFYDWALIADHLKNKLFLVAANFSPTTQSIVQDIRNKLREPIKPLREAILQDTFSPLIAKTEYQQSFESIYHALVSGRAYQVNYTQPFIAHYKGSAWALYHQIRNKNPVPYAAFINTPEGAILSFSPERFLMMDDRVVTTSPIKGTVMRSTHPEEDVDLLKMLQQSAKNRAENVMIVDLLRNDLGKIAEPGSVKVTALLEVQSFSQVHHLVSTVEAKCRAGLGAVDVFAACFPGGSITGAPKLEAMRVINEQEKYARGVYCGSIAYFSSHGRMDSNIAIRTITAKDNTLYLPAGGGIVIDSRWDDEYHECLTKISAIVNALS